MENKVKVVVIMVDSIKTKSYPKDPKIGIDIDLTCGMISAMATFASESAKSALKAIIMPPWQVVVAYMCESPQIIVWALIDGSIDMESAYKILEKFAIKYMNDNIIDLPNLSRKIQSDGINNPSDSATS